MLDTGTTTLQIARKLIDKRKITIITTSLAIVSEVQFASGIKVILLGGVLRGGSPDIHGPLTEQNVNQFKADIAFMGADAVDSNGNTYTDDLRVVNLDKRMASSSNKVVIVADSSKFGGSAMCGVFNPDDYDLIISDSGINKNITRQFKRKKINLQIA
jgi:DeoR/GlpR family transcriptional regulator of sugar metabolism